MIKELTKLANELDNRSLVKEANYIDKILKQAAGQGWQDYQSPLTDEQLQEAGMPASESTPEKENVNVEGPTVYIVAMDIEHGGSSIQGAFSTRDKARLAIVESGNEYALPSGQMEIYEFKLDVVKDDALWL
jgi:hypothetical protein